MLYLLFSILLNAYLGIVFAYFKKFNIDIFQAIVFNYGACVITGCIVLGQVPFRLNMVHEGYFKWAVVMGILFISVFNLIGVSSVKAGITITQTSNKLSLVIPVIFATVFYHEILTPIKIAGILTALLAVAFVSFKKKGIGVRKSSVLEYTLPLILFISSGIIDSLTKFVQQTFLHSESASNVYLITGFFTAFCMGVFALLYLYNRRRRKFEFRFLWAGIILGVPNYFSIYYLVKALQCNTLSSSAIIPINNISVLFLVSLFGIYVFKEKLSKLNYLGLLLTLLAILLIFSGDKI